MITSGYRTADKFLSIFVGNYLYNEVKCNNSVFNNHFYLQVDGTAMDPHMSCSSSDIAMYKFDVKVLNYKTSLLCWKRFRDDVHVLWNQSLEEIK